MYFPDWEGSFDNAESENADLVDGLSKSTQIDTKALFTPPRAVTVDAKDLALVEETMAHFNSLLVNMTSFVFKDGKFKTVKMEGKSEFFLDDSYIFLCVYKTEDVAKESSETQQESSPQGSHLECIVYFWKGRKSRRGIYVVVNRQGTLKSH